VLNIANLPGDKEIFQCGKEIFPVSYQGIALAMPLIPRNETPL
jgi:hypothetical protein